MAIDEFSNKQYDLDDPAYRSFAITPHNTNELAIIPKAIYVGGAGSIAMRGLGDSADVSWVAVPVGTIIPFRAQYIRVTGTTATNLVGIY